MANNDGKSEGVLVSHKSQQTMKLKAEAMRENVVENEVQSNVYITVPRLERAGETMTNKRGWVTRMKQVWSQKYVPSAKCNLCESQHR
jgi:hypothetical protein